MFFCKNKSSANITLPINWPSHLHNKCDNKKCLFPNDPQPAEGIYDCKGIPSGFFCDGHYYISPARALETDKFYKEQFRLEAEARKRAALKKKQEEEQARQEALNYRREERARRCAAAELQARFEAERQQARCKSPDQFYQNQPLERRTAQRSRQRGEPVTPPQGSPDRRVGHMPSHSPAVFPDPRQGSPGARAIPQPGDPRALPRHPAERLPPRPIEAGQGSLPRTRRNLGLPSNPAQYISRPLPKLPPQTHVQDTSRGYSPVRRLEPQQRPPPGWF